MRNSSIHRVAATLFLLASLAGTSAAALTAGQGSAAQATAVFTFTPTADAYVIKSQASSNFGGSTSLRADASPVTRSYLRFALTGLNGASVQSAKLRVYANSTNSTGISILALSNNTWSESTIAYRNAPAPGALITRSTGFSSGSWVELDVSSYVKAQVTYSLVITTTSSTNINMSSREAGATAPQLVVTTIASATATITALPTFTSTPTQTPTPLPAATATNPPTSTATATATDLPTATASSTPTATATELPASTATGTPTATAMELPTSTATGTPTATATSQASWQPSFPIRAAFYYPWFPQAWTQQGIYPYTNYTPQLGYYSSTDQNILKQHIAMMQYGKIQAGIASWWGQGSQTDSKIGGLLSAASGTSFRWALYYEMESQGDPTAAQIENDLTYIRDHYAGDPAYLRVNGRFVIFVYAAGNDACGMGDRWKQGNTVGAYVALKVFSGYRLCTSQPDSWHQYAPAVAADRQGSYSYSISPGFRLVGQTPRLTRDLTRWGQNVRDMVASGANWQLVTTFSEWGEGTAVEPALEWSSASGDGQYLDVLLYDGYMP